MCEPEIVIVEDRKFVDRSQLSQPGASSLPVESTRHLGQVRLEMAIVIQTTKLSNLRNQSPDIVHVMWDNREDYRILSRAISTRQAPHDGQRI